MGSLEPKSTAFIMSRLVSCCIQYQMISRIKGPLLKHFFPSFKLSAEVYVTGVCM